MKETQLQFYSTSAVLQLTLFLCGSSGIQKAWDIHKFLHNCQCQGRMPLLLRVLVRHSRAFFFGYCTVYVQFFFHASIRSVFFIPFVQFHYWLLFVQFSFTICSVFLLITIRSVFFGYHSFSFFIGYLSLNYVLVQLFLIALTIVAFHFDRKKHSLIYRHQINYVTKKLISESCKIKPNMVFKYTFPIDLSPEGNPFGMITIYIFI